MCLKLPESSRNTIESFEKHIRIVGDYIPDTDYNHLTLEFNLNQGGGNREMTAQELLHTKKYGTVVQKQG